MQPFKALIPDRFTVKTIDCRLLLGMSSMFPRDSGLQGVSSSFCLGFWVVDSPRRPYLWKAGSTDRGNVDVDDMWCGNHQLPFVPCRMDWGSCELQQLPSSLQQVTGFVWPILALLKAPTPRFFSMPL